MYDKFLDQMTDLIFLENEPEHADIIFIPGSGFWQMAEKAAELYLAGYAPYILPSGRYSVLTGVFQGVEGENGAYSGIYETEWEFLKSVLVKNGVPEEVILKEDQATYTYQNAIYSKEVTDRLKIHVKKAVICCKPVHARRVLLYYQLLYPDTEFLICPAENCGITRENWFLTEEGCKAVLGEISRCGSQFHKIMEEIREKLEYR